MVELPRTSLYLRALRWSLSLGAVYDAVIAGLMLFAPQVPERIFKVPPPGEPFYLWLLGVVLLMLAAFYALGAYDPVSYRGNILVAIVGRTAAAGVLALGAWKGGLPGLYPLALGDLFFAALHAVFLWRVGR